MKLSKFAKNTVAIMSAYLVQSLRGEADEESDIDLLVDLGKL